MGDVIVIGVDGCAAGWVAVTLGTVSRPAKAAASTAVASTASASLAAEGTAAEGITPGDGTAEDVTVKDITVAATLDGLPLAGVTGIDMPLGLLAAGWRDADRLARRVLGRRGVTVFAIPPRPVWECATFAEANRVCRDLTGQGFSVQAWGLRRKIAEADAFRRRARPGPGGVQLYEVHPELAFAALAGAPLPDGKHTRAGLAARRALLAAAGLTLPPRVAGAAEDDLLDAAAVAWSARRIAADRAAVLTSPAQRADDGGELAIRY